MTEKAYVFLADGFEEIEGLTPVDVLRRGGIDVVTVSVEGHMGVQGSHGIKVEADAVFEDVDFSDGTLFMLPGGMPGTKRLRANKGLCELLVKMNEEGRRIAAICAAPSVLGDLGILSGKQATCYPGYEDQLKGAEYIAAQVVISGNVTTGRGMGVSLPFALELLDQAAGSEKAGQIAKAVQWQE